MYWWRFFESNSDRYNHEKIPIKSRWCKLYISNKSNFFIFVVNLWIYYVTMDTWCHSEQLTTCCFFFCRVVDDIWTVEDLLVFSFANEPSMTSWLGTVKIPREQIQVEEFNFNRIAEKQRHHAKKRVCSFDYLLFTFLFLEFVPFFVCSLIPLFVGFFCSSLPLVPLENSVSSFVFFSYVLFQEGISAKLSLKHKKQKYN